DVLKGNDPAVAKYGFTQTQWNTINWRARPAFEGTNLDRTAINSIGWDVQTNIKLSDWASLAPNVTTIAAGAFDGLSLTGIEIPDKVTTIGTNAFRNTNSLLGSNVSMLDTLKGTNPTVAKYGFTQTQWNTINWRSSRQQFQGTTLNRAAVTLVGWSTQTNITLSDWTTWAPNVTIIDAGAFDGLSLVSIEIPNKVITIGNNAFRNTNALSSISINSLSELKSIGNNAFENSGITAISLPKTVTTIGTDAFKNTSSLTSITFPHSVYRESVTTPYGLTPAQWNSVVWKDFPESGIIDKIIARNLLQVNNNIIEWANIKNFSSIESEAFMNTDIKYIEIQAKEGFTIGTGAFTNTSLLVDIILDESYRDIVDTLGFTEQQIQNIDFTSAKASNNTGAIVGSIIAVLAVAGLGVGGFFYWKYMQKQKALANQNNQDYQDYQSDQDNTQDYQSDQDNNLDYQ
ncbi:MAG: leucine-rich repeat domain-containing protein, partial [Metamycoplasmataceae bacterium]